MDKDLKCVWLHYNNPYLWLGPFKFEFKHQNPEIALIHDFINEEEAQKIKMLARGRMKSTPYIVTGEGKGFSKQRTSKVMYLNEKLVPEAMVLSQRIEIATRLKLSHEQFASENFQIMNYGIGGKINAHVDSPGVIFAKDYIDENGNFKVSFMKPSSKIKITNTNVINREFKVNFLMILKKLRIICTEITLRKFFYHFKFTVDG